MMTRLFQERLLPKYLIGSYLLIAPFLIIPTLGMYDSKRILQLFLFTTLALAFLFFAFQYDTKTTKLHFPKRLTILGCLILGMGIISSFSSEFGRYAFIELIMVGIIFLCSVLLSQRSLKGHYRLGKFIYAVALAFSSVYVVYFFGNYIASHLNPLVPLWPDRIAVSIQIGETTYRGTEVLNFVHKRFFNHIQTWTLPLITSSAVYFYSKTIYKNLVYGLLICWWMLVFASGARGTSISFLIVCIVLFVLFRKRSYRYIGIAAGTAVGGFLLYYFLFQIFVPSEPLPVVRMSDSGRLEMWAKALEMWASNPVLGAGPMHYAAVGTEPYFAHPHNFYLQLLAEWGMVAFACFLALPVLYFLFINKKFLKNNFAFLELSSRNTAVYMGFIGSAVAGFAHTGVSGVFHTPMSQVWAIIICAWLISLWNRYADSEKTLSIKRKHLSLAFVLLLAGLFFLIRPDISGLDRNHTQYREKFENAKLYPRFWEQGLIYEE